MSKVNGEQNFNLKTYKKNSVDGEIEKEKVERLLFL
jgi:hypothetical protein